MTIQRTANNGIPILNGIWYADSSFVGMHFETAQGGTRIGVCETRRSYYVPPPNAQRSGWIYTVREPVPGTDGEMLCVCGYLDRFGIGNIMMLNSSHKMQWVANFEAAEPFEDMTVRAHYCIAYTASGEMWKFDYRDRCNVRVSILHKEQFFD